MEVDTIFFHIVPPIFDSGNSQAWAARMTVYLNAMDLWDEVEEDYDVPSLPVNLMMNQLKTHKEKKTRKSKPKHVFLCYFKQNIYKNHEFGVRKRNLGLPQERISGQ
ncbi:hypothetical protein J1N35_005064 [Gossypium stocksii]|uniref:DUF4219 domain-containing protein n=1 Tax=Gossypium stocksii TaxID=47602 RepID=A0A9D3WC55_9ROSI|nr:hypothetical protein J1N35_005064 [Gossypium stocksii]